MGEFDLIQKFFHNIGSTRDDVVVGIGDDTASLIVPPDHFLCVSTDTLVAGTHFLSTHDPFDVAIKALNVNISDIAARGAKPAWVTLALTLPDADLSWLNRFSQGLDTTLKKYGLSLVGGDTTRGPLSLSLTIMGFAKSDFIITRKGAKVGDAIFVTGPLGLSALNVYDLKHACLNEVDRDTSYKRLMHPTPRLDFGPILQDFATSAIDISDGLSQDLGHILSQSGVGATLQYNKIPAHRLLNEYLSPQQAQSLVLGGGEDYELCFTVSSSQKGQFYQAVNRLNLEVYEIGYIEEKLGLRLLSGNDICCIQASGYDHFS